MARINDTNGDNTIHGTGRNDDIRAKKGDDWVDAGDGNHMVRGGAGDDTLIGGAGADKLYGGSGDDVLMGDGPNAGGGSGSGSGRGRGSGSGSGSGSHRGSGSGSAEVSFNDYQNGGSGDDTVLGQLGNDTLKGGSGNDFLDGGVGRDHVDGDSGDDVGLFVGGENGGGIDWYDGGTGSDTLVVSLTAAQFTDAGILADLIALNQFITDNADSSTDSGAKQTFSNLGIRVQDWENLQILVDGEPVDLDLDPLFTEQPDAVDFDDVQAGTYEDGTQYDSLASDDTVTFASNEAEANEAGYDTDVIFDGGAGDDTLTGRGMDDRIAGGADDDTIAGNDGDDLLIGDNLDDGGVSESFVATGNQQAWLDAGVTLTAYDFDGSAGTVTYDAHGAGVAGGSPVGNQINHSSDGTSETLVATFDSPAIEATVTVARMYATENGGEQGAWEAFDADGNSVGSGTFGPEITGGGNVGSFTISGIGAFSEIRFTGREYANGTAPGAGDSSDYYVQTIAYTTVGGLGEDGDDIIDGGAGDDLIFGDSVSDPDSYGGSDGDFPEMPHAVSNMVLYLQDGSGDIIKVKIDDFDGDVHDPDDLNLQQFIEDNFGGTTLVERRSRPVITIPAWVWARVSCSFSTTPWTSRTSKRPGIPMVQPITSLITPTIWLRSATRRRSRSIPFRTGQTAVTTRLMPGPVMMLSSPRAATTSSSVALATIRFTARAATTSSTVTRRRASGSRTLPTTMASSWICRCLPPAASSAPATVCSISSRATRSASSRRGSRRSISISCARAWTPRCGFRPSTSASRRRWTAR